VTKIDDFAILASKFNTTLAASAQRTDALSAPSPRPGPASPVVGVQPGVDERELIEELR
jgi:hypothetical protein